jgi:hypothetical protein
VDVESAPRTQPAVAAHLDASHRVFPPLKLKRCSAHIPLWQAHPSVLHSGHVLREEQAWGDRTFSRSLMARCVVGKGLRSIHRSDAANTMRRCVCSMLPAELPVVAVPCARSVKDMAPPPKNRVVSARSCIPCRMWHQKIHRLCAFVPLIPFCGGIGHAVSLAVPGEGGSVAIWFSCKSHPFRHLAARLHHLSGVLSEPIGL